MVGFKKVLVMVLVLLVSFFVLGCGKEKPFNQLGERKRTRILMEMSNDSISKILKSPSTAKFSKDKNEYIIFMDKKWAEDKRGNTVATWRIKSYVDAQNSFGAMIRSRYTVVLEVDNEPKKDGGYTYRICDHNLY